MSPVKKASNMPGQDSEQLALAWSSQTANNKLNGAESDQASEL